MNTWVEAALNGPWKPAIQPRVPIGVDQLVAEGIACAQAGASIIHVHAFDDDGNDDVEGSVYAHIIEGIRGAVDCLVYPSIPATPSPDVDRFGHLTYLVDRGLLELTVVDPGSVNLFAGSERPREYPSFVYSNSPAEIAEGLEYCSKYGVHPGFAIYEPGFTRAGAEMTKSRPVVPQPIYRFMFSDGLSFGFPPRPASIDSHLEVLETEAPGALWMVAGLDLDVTPLVAHAVQRGGGVRTGLEDAPFGCENGNIELIEQLVSAVVEAGSAPATPAEIRAGLSAIPTP